MSVNRHMDYLRSCSTTAQVVDGFQRNLSSLWSVQTVNDSSNPAPGVASQDSAIITLKAEALLRQEGYLVDAEVATNTVWVFFTSAAQDSDKFGLFLSLRERRIEQSLPLRDGVSLRCLRAGPLSEPRKLPAGGSQPNQSQTAPSVTSAAQNVRAFKANQNVQQMQQNNGDSSLVSPSATPSSLAGSQLDLYHQFHSHFLTAAAGSLIYQLATHSELLPVDSRTLLSYHSLAGGIAERTHPEDDRVIALTTIDVRMSKSHKLIVTSLSVQYPNIVCLDDIGPKELESWQDQGHGILVPNGQTCRVKSTYDAKKLIYLPNFLDWQTTLETWLSWKGITISISTPDSRWALVEMSQSDSIDSRAGNILGGSVALWPTSLCFLLRGSGRSDGEILGNRNTREKSLDTWDDRTGLQWFQPLDMNGYSDPLEFSQSWLRNKRDREAFIQEQKNKKRLQDTERAQEDAAENLMQVPSSPIYSRIGAYGDLQSVSGIYPTPPDGVQQLGNTATNLSDGPGHNPDSQQAVSIPPDQMALLDMDLDGILENPFHSGPDTHEDMHHDDLFGDMDMDEDMFGGGTRVTDDDFSFFDEPDAIERGAGEAGSGETPNLTSAAGESNKTSGQAQSIVKPIKLLGINEVLADSARFSEEPVSPVVADQQPALKDHGMTLDTSPSKYSDIDRRKGKQVIESPSTRTDPGHERADALNPVFVKPTMLLSDADEQLHLNPDRRASLFDAIAFNHALVSSDSKYSTSGRFGFITEPPKESDDETPRRNVARGIPTIGQAKRTRPIVPRITAVDLADHRKPYYPASSFTSSSGVSESDLDERYDSDGSPASLPHTEEQNVHGKRKRGMLDYDSDIVESPDANSIAQTIDLDQLNLPLLSKDGISWDYSSLLLTREQQGVGLVRRSVTRHQKLDSLEFFSAEKEYPSPGESQMTEHEIDSDETELSEADEIGIAQVLADQVIHTPLDLLSEEPEGEVTGTSPAGNESWEIKTVVQAALKKIYKQVSDCDVSKLASISDGYAEPPIANKAQPRPTARRTNTASLPFGDHPMNTGAQTFTIPAPQIRVSRVDSNIELLPSAASFWEPLGLGPASGEKHVKAYCIYPDSQDLWEPVSRFTGTMAETFGSCKLGEMVFGQVGPGLLPVRVNGPLTVSNVLQAFKITCGKLGEQLGRQQSPGYDTVIYIINPFRDPESLKYLCVCFWRLFEAYRRGSESRYDSPVGRENDIILQIIPIEFVVSLDKLVIPQQEAFSRLVRSVYDRLPPPHDLMEKFVDLKIRVAPAIELEETIPKSIQFKLVSDPPSDLLHENSYLHVAYAWSVDRTWITAAWTDNIGKSQATVSYSMAGKRRFPEVAREIWQTSIEIMAGRRVSWRLIIVSAGIMGKVEKNIWMSLASMQFTAFSVTTTILNLDPSPPVALTASPLPNILAATGGNPPTATTPGSTPTGTASPDALGSVPTPVTPSDPPLEADSDAHLIDLTDETWGIVLGHRLRNSEFIGDFEPGLASGYLVKRGSASATGQGENLVTIALNILWVGGPTSSSSSMAGQLSVQNTSSVTAQGVQSTGSGASQMGLAWRNLELMLREIMVLYRGLGLLAKLRNMRDTREGTLPWHVAAAMRGAKGLERCM